MDQIHGLKGACKFRETHWEGNRTHIGGIRILRTLLFNLRPTGVPAERVQLKGGRGKNYPTPPANSRTNSRSEVGEAAIESTQRVL